MRQEEMEALVNDVVFNSSVNAQNKVDVKFEDDIKNCIHILGNVFAILDRIINHTDQSRVSDCDFDSQMILWQGGSTLIGSLQLIRQGYVFEPLFLMRNSIESLSMTLSFYGRSGEKLYKKFSSQQLSGEKCIAEAKKLMKQIGPIYGLLSEVTHPSKKTLGHFYMKDRGTLLVGGGVTDKTLYRVKFNLAVINFLSTIYWSSAELIFNDYLDSCVFWKKQGDLMKWHPASKEKAVYLRSHTLFKEALAEQAKIGF